jgi:hypothetical protein
MLLELSTGLFWSVPFTFLGPLKFNLKVAAFYYAAVVLSAIWVHIKVQYNWKGSILLQIAAERERIANNPKSIIPAAFVAFKTRWGAAVCAQTQQSRNPTLWLTEWAPEPRDVFWKNLAIPYVSLTVRRLIVAVAFFFLTFFFMIPITFVQSLATIEGIEKVAPFLKHLIEK